MFDFPLPRITAEIRSVFLKGDKGDPGDTGPAGPQGEPGKAPRIGENDNWEIYDNETQAWKDTGVRAKGVHSYNELTDVPETFPPEAHGHEAGDVSGLSAVATSGAYADLTGAPEEVSQFENDANYQTDAQVAQAIDAIEIGGRNLLLNSGNIIERTSNVKPGSGWYTILYKISEYGKSNISRLHAGDIVMLSCEIKASSKFDSSFDLRDFNANKGYSDAGKVSASTAWERKNVKIRINTDSPTPKEVGLAVPPQDTAITVSVKNIKLEFGSKATDWTPAPEDICPRHAGITYDYGGRNLKEVFGTAEDLHNALAAEDYSQISVGDYWPITLNGTFWDYGSYSIQIGTDYYNNPEFSGNKVNTTSGTIFEGSYYSDTAVKIGSPFEVDRYVRIEECLPYFERTCNNVAVKLEVVGINHYWKYGTTGNLITGKPHIVFGSRDALPFQMRMRKGEKVWENDAAENPWIGSAMYKTFNDAEHGIIKLIEADDIGKYIFSEPDSDGMYAYMERKTKNDVNASGWVWLHRGKLFLPFEPEITGATYFATQKFSGGVYNQFDLYRGSRRHITKGLGDGGTRQSTWTASSMEGRDNFFVYADGNGSINYINTIASLATPIYFVFS